MTNRTRNLTILGLVLALLLGAGFVIVSKETRLGLDLQGGIELVYEARPTPQVPEVTQESIDDAIQTMRERVDAFGVAEPEIQRSGRNQISVGLPDVQNADRAREQVGTTAQLQFYDWEPNVLVRSPDSPFAGSKALYDAVEAASKQKPKAEQTDVPPDSNLSPKQADARNDTKSTDQYYLFGPDRFPIGPDGKPLRFEPYQPSGNCDELLSDFEQGPGPPHKYAKDTECKAQREAFARVTKRIAERGARVILPPGADREQAFQRFAITLDDKIVSLATIDFIQNPEGIDGSTGAQIENIGDFNATNDLAENLRIGALPIELKLISETQVSATLGQQALHQGLIAGAVGLALTILFLLVFYRVLGLVATAALLVYAVFLFALVKLIPITLTLPGIAGLVLTLAVAADANIVMYERIKEEVREGRSIPG